MKNSITKADFAKGRFHLVLLKRESTPESFLSSLSFDYRVIEEIDDQNPSYTPEIRPLFPPPDCYSFATSDNHLYNQWLDRTLAESLHRLSIGKDFPIFLFTSTPRFSIRMCMADAYTVLSFNEHTRSGIFFKRTDGLPGPYLLPSPYTPTETPIHPISLKLTSNWKCAYCNTTHTPTAEVYIDDRTKKFICPTCAKKEIAELSR